MPNPFDLINAHVSVSRETVQRLSLYHDILLKWQKQINLISPDSIQDAWHRHFLDSLQLLKYLPNVKKPIVDLGSGGGFPGMVMAIALADADVHLVESDKRKTIFLKEVARITGAKVTVHHSRIEDNPVGEAGVILSRACSDLSQLLSWSEPYVSHETISFFHKGKNYATELDNAKASWQFDHDVFASITEPQSAIIKLSNITRRGIS